MENCVFCGMIAGEVASEKVYEDDQAFVVKDINPQAPVHLLIIPREHVSSLLELDSQESQVSAHLLSLVQKMARDHDLETNGFRVVVNTGPEGGQTVGHLHIHLLGGRVMRWPPG